MSKVAAFDAATFLRSFRDAVLHRALPKDRTQKCWTAWATECLHDVQRGANLGCTCHHAAHGSADRPPGEIAIKRENLWDLTWYRWRTKYEHPVVAIEHENLWTEEAFARDAWKLTMALAPLRIMIGYSKTGDEHSQRAAWWNEMAKHHHWHFPPHCEDLVLIGHQAMGPADYQVYWRRHRESALLRVGSLGAFPHISTPDVGG